MAEAVYKLGVSGGLHCHCWSQDSSMLAVSHGARAASVYTRRGSGWERVSELDQHDLMVTSIDWAPRSNRIVTCSQDRNAYVWLPDGAGGWRHTLVLLRINRAATCVRWAPQENKFAVGSGARIVSVCYHDQDNDWWVAKHIKKPLRSTVTSLAWHPNNILLAAGSTDYKVRVFSAYIKDIETKPSPTVWGSKMPFAHLMTEFSNSDSGGGWVHCVSFSEDGGKLAWVGHDSSIAVAEAGLAVRRLRTDCLPLVSLVWISPVRLVCGGHDCVPLVFRLTDDGGIVLAGRLEDSQPREPREPQEAGGGLAAMRMFQSKDRTGEVCAGHYSLSTTHQNQITEVRRVPGGQMVSTTGGDGRLCVWRVTEPGPGRENI